MKLKRFFALMLALALSLTMLQGVAFGAGEQTISVPNALNGSTPLNMEFTLNADGTAQVGSVRYPPSPAIATTAAGALVIPATVTHGGITYTVTDIGQLAFIGCKALTSVTFPDSVDVIGEGAFAGCTSLTSVTLPAGVTDIWQYAFDGCTSLTSVTFNGSAVTGIANSAFDGANQLTTINLAGDFNQAMVKLLANALADAANTNSNPLTLSNITINYNQSWTADEVEALKQALLDAGIAEADMPTLNPYNPNPTPTGGSTGSAGAGAWYIGTLNANAGSSAGGSTFVPTYTQISDEQSTTEMLQQGSTITVTGQSPTGIIVKLDPTALAGKQNLSIENSIADMQLTAEQIASLIQQADGNTIYITIKATPVGSTINILAGGRTITL